MLTCTYVVLFVFSFLVLYQCMVSTIPTRISSTPSDVVKLLTKSKHTLYPKPWKKLKMRNSWRGSLFSHKPRVTWQLIDYIEGNPPSFGGPDDRHLRVLDKVCLREGNKMPSHFLKKVANITDSRVLACHHHYYTSHVPSWKAAKKKL